MRFTTHIGFTKRIHKEHKPLSRNLQYILLSLAPGYFLLWGLLLQPFPEMVRGLMRIFVEPDFLITDYVAVGGAGAALVNASLITLMCIALMYFLNMNIEGSSIAALSLMLGFSLFGKNLVNIWSIILGVFIYAKYHKTHLSNYLYIGFYGTSLSPIITQTIQFGHFSLPVRLAMSLLVGIIIGFVMPPLCAHFYNTHKGYSLYNGGFTAGIIATVIISIYKSFGLALESRKLWAAGYNIPFSEILISFFVILIFIGALTDKNAFRKYWNILKYPGLSGTDFTFSEGFSPTLINMGIDGIFCTLYLLAIGAELNGASIGGIFTVVGFSATGKTLRNITPIMLGITLLAALSGNYTVTDPAVVLALMFGTTIAPIAGQYGFLIGILAGFLHAAVVLNIGIVYSGMNLYNNGFAGGIVAAFLVPIIKSIQNRQAKVKGVL
ncbi:DUF1576 domain-containing protein [Frisingicoccus sp.]|uniref:DUF1576 domain-containing protein n=1 Tax=Frisingicoccus sp. TaxID=1918627 RepID=UPI003AB74618